MNRRQLIKRLALGAAALTLMPLKALAAWNQKAFHSEFVDPAVEGLFGSKDAKPSVEIELKAPTIAENGALVPITVRTDLPNVTRIAIAVHENPRPLAAAFELSPLSVADVATRVRMAKTTDVTAYVESDGQLYSVTQQVKVTIGGCGG